MRAHQRDGRHLRWLPIDPQVASGDDRGRKGHIRDARREQPHRVERPREALHPDRRQHAIGRLVAGDAAIGRRPDHRAAGLAADGDRHHAGGDRRRRAGR